TGPLYRLRVVWGTADATNTADVDFPPRGGTLTVWGAQVRCQLSSLLAVPGGSNLPILQGWVRPGQRSPKTQDTPTLTTQPTVVGTTSQVVFPIPSRAIAYRIYDPQNLIGAAQVALVQLKEDAVTPTSTDALINATALPTADDLTSNRAAWYPLNVQSQ